MTNKDYKIGKEVFGEEIVPDEGGADEQQSEEALDQAIIDKRSRKEHGAAVSGFQHTKKKQSEITDFDPTFTSGDIDADWQDSDMAEEVSTGSNPTPDQDQVDEIAENFGLDYSDDEALDVGKKLKNLEEKRERDEG